MLFWHWFSAWTEQRPIEGDAPRIASYYEKEYGSLNDPRTSELVGLHLVDPKVEIYMMVVETSVVVDELHHVCEK
jgi:hypothetical protein